jgi:hypothetical protein
LPLDLDLSGDAAAMDEAPGIPLVLADFDGDDDGVCWAYRNADGDFGIEEPVESDELREARERRLTLDLDVPLVVPFVWDDAVFSSRSVADIPLEDKLELPRDWRLWRRFFCGDDDPDADGVVSLEEAAAVDCAEGAVPVDLCTGMRLPECSNGVADVFF